MYYYKYNAFLLHILLLHFTRNKFDETSDWGMRNTNGSWDGMVGKLVNNQADIALADLYVSVDRLEVLDFLFTLQTTS
jgi:hypothetical protein